MELLDVDEQTTQLHQLPTTLHAVESWLTFRLVLPYAIDFSFRYRLHDPERFETNYAGFFFASYLFEPENKAIYLLSKDADRSLSWHQFSTNYHGASAAVVWEMDDYALEFSKHDHGLYRSRAPITYREPLFFGRRNNMVCIWMMQSPAGLVICHGLGGGLWRDNSDHNPAWDFLLYRTDPQQHPQGEWRGRLVYKRFVGRDDVLQEYQAYQQSLGHDWHAPTSAPLR